MKKLIALLSAVLTTVGLAFSAAPANAYPTGQNLTLNLSSTSVVPGGSVIASATNAYPGCGVVFSSTYNKKIVQRFTAPANQVGQTGNVIFTMPNVGIYTIAATYSCNGFAEKASRNVTSGLQTTTTITSFTATSATFRVVGTLKFGMLAVQNFSGTAVFSTLNGTKLASASVKTTTDGSFSASASPRKAIASGTYRVTVTFASSGDYLGSSATTTTVRSAVVKLASAKQYAPKVK